MITDNLAEGLKRVSWPAFFLKSSERDRQTIQAEKGRPPADEARLLSRLNEAMARLSSIKGLLADDELIVDAAVGLVDADAGYLQLIGPTGETRPPVAYTGFTQEAIDHIAERFPADAAAQKQALQSGRIIVMDDLETRPSLTPVLTQLSVKPSRCGAVIPLTDRCGMPVGVLTLHLHSRASWTVAELDALEIYARWLGVSMPPRQARERDPEPSAEERLHLVLEVAGLGMWDWNLLDGAMAWNDVHYQLLGYADGEVEASADTWGERIHPQDQAMVANAFREAMRSHRDLQLHYRLRLPDGTERWCAIKGRFLYSPEGLPLRMTAVVEDVTNRREAEARQRILAEELGHRSRNLLTVVQSIAMQSMEHSKSWEEFQQAFDGRITSLARVQELLSRQDTMPITLDTLLRMELGAFCPDGDGEKILLDGPHVVLDAKVAQTLALGLHELATNAIKYGGLSHARGRLSVTWWLEEDGHEKRLRLEWEETHISPPSRKNGDGAHGYGRTLIEEELPYNLSAQTSFELMDDALRCFISVPLETR